MTQRSLWQPAALGMLLFNIRCQAFQEKTSLTTLSTQAFSDPESNLAYSKGTLVGRNIVFIPTSSLQTSNHTSAPVTSTPISTTTIFSSSTVATVSNPSSTGNSTVYRLDIPENTGGSNNLKYLYLFFLLLGLIILALIARVIMVKRRRARKLEKRAYNRNEALRLDLENRASDENQSPERSQGHVSPAGSGTGGSVEDPIPTTTTATTRTRTGYTFPLFSMSLFRHPSNGNESNRNQPQPSRMMEEVANPPPPYPTHVKPAYFRDSRLPVYQEVSEEEDGHGNEYDRVSELSESHSQRHLRSPSRLDTLLSEPPHDNQQEAAEINNNDNNNERAPSIVEEGFSFVSRSVPQAPPTG